LYHPGRDARHFDYCRVQQPIIAAKPSAAAACKDFNSWLAATGVDVTSGKDGSILASAVKAAPSGNLYQDMSTLQSNVQSATAAKGSSLFTGERLMALEDAQQVQTDCSSVNPSS
jgi:hypothetical protein